MKATPPRVGDTVRVTFDGVVGHISPRGLIVSGDSLAGIRVPADAKVEVLTREPVYEPGLYEDASGGVWRTSVSPDGEPEWECPGDLGCVPFTRPKRPLHRLVRQSDTTGGTDGN